MLNIRVTGPKLGGKTQIVDVIKKALGKAGLYSVSVSDNGKVGVVGKGPLTVQLTSQLEVPMEQHYTKEDFFHAFLAWELAMRTGEHPTREDLNLLPPGEVAQRAASMFEGYLIGYKFADNTTGFQPD